MEVAEAAAQAVGAAHAVEVVVHAVEAGAHAAEDPVENHEEERDRAEVGEASHVKNDSHEADELAVEADAAALAALAEDQSTNAAAC